MSKAALNMFTKTLSIEMKRHNTVVVSMHPGTTDTDLSRPFQKNVKKEKLFPVEHSVDMMLNVIWNTKSEDTGKFFAYDGSEIPY
jgi:NAD(P)-dependent dehydrogenase (short-subunit alcohol dehydrogenase family)